MIISQIVAVAQNGAIGKNNDLIWRLPADLKYFKNTTSGHHIIMGRKNYESIGRPLPNRTNIIITRQSDFTAPGCIVLHSLDEAIQYAQHNMETEAFIIGGGEIYKSAMEITDKIYYTEVHDSFDADTFYPQLDPLTWRETAREAHQKDEKNSIDYSFVIYERI